MEVLGADGDCYYRRCQSIYDEHNTLSISFLSFDFLTSPGQLVVYNEGFYDMFTNLTMSFVTVTTIAAPPPRSDGDSFLWATLLMFGVGGLIILVVTVLVAIVVLKGSKGDQSYELLDDIQ